MLLVLSFCLFLTEDQIVAIVKLKQAKGDTKSLKIVAVCAILLAICVVTFLIYIKIENRKFKITKYYYQNKNVPMSFDGTKIAFISDLHNYCYGKDNNKLIDAIVQENPDYVFIGGDMIVKGPQFDGTIALHFIEELAKKYPVYYANGNHELRISELPETKDSTYVEYIDKLHELGVHYLVNQSINLERGKDCIELVGLNLGEEYFEKFSTIKLTLDQIETLIGKPKQEALTILLAHNPSYFEKYSEWGADVILSGHVHGGMIALPFLGGIISTQGLLFPKYDFGAFNDKNATMYLSRGIGNHTIHIRVNNRAEVLMLTLNKKND